MATLPAPVKYILVPASVDDQYCGLDAVQHIGRPYVVLPVENPVMTLPTGHDPALVVPTIELFPSMIFLK
jgi:hypothetical protein